MHNRFRKPLKIVCFIIALMGTLAINAQSTADVAQTGTAVKVVDNKGTIKYFQATNGLTQIVNTTSDVTTTTWQLGGTLTDDTDIATGANELKITLDAGGTYVIDGLAQETGTASDGTTIGTSGWTLLSRDEATGEIKKILAEDLVTGIYNEYTQAANAAADVTISVTGIPAITPGTANAGKLFVYRNGVKLRLGTDFSVNADEVVITYSATELPMYAGDIVEVQYVK